MVIVDTTVWIDYFRGTDTAETFWLEQAIGKTNLGLTDLVLCEVLQGVRNERLFKEVVKALAKYELFTTGGQELAIASARNYRQLRERGRTVRKTIDCLIATFCLTGGHSLLHRDRDFDPFEQFLGLQVVHPLRH